MKVDMLQPLDNIVVPDDGWQTTTGTNFCYDFRQKHDAAYNSEAVSVFAEDFLFCISKHKWYSNPPIAERFLTLDCVENAIRGHLAYITRLYKVTSSQGCEILSDTSPNRKYVAARRSRKQKVCPHLPSLLGPADL